MASIHETMDSLYEIRAINKQTMRQFDEACLTPIYPLTPEEIRKIREKEHVSQSVFSHYSKSLLRGSFFIDDGLTYDLFLQQEG